MSLFFKIATWNVNSIRIRIEQLAKWLQRNNIDIVLLQEIKCENTKFPYEILEDIGYNCYVSGQKTYNGVAIISKHKADNIIVDFDDNPCKNEARFIMASLMLPIGYSIVTSVYVPNGRDVGSETYKLKLDFLNGLKKFVRSREFGVNFILGGDFNVAQNESDVYSVAEFEGKLLFTNEERACIRAIKNSGVIDPTDFLLQKNSNFTWWDYRNGDFQNNRGARIDYFLTSPGTASIVLDQEVDVAIRSMNQPSDHAPVILTLKMHK
ncbi:MAG: exodeoxyribonuclease III [Rickettsiaceae bacterium]|nr:exodeoxyribonuclease III [Rickettsiaceae bacterium]